MKRVSIALALVLAVSATAFVWAKCDDKGGGCGGCCGKTTPATQPAKPINTICPVEGGKVKPGVTTVYEGKVIGFCCPDCIPEFKKDPAKYMKDIK